LLGTAPDPVVAKRLGRTVSAVAQRRVLLGIRSVSLGRWTAEEDEMVRRLPATEAARLTGRGLNAVAQRRTTLRVPPPPRKSRWTPELLAALADTDEAEIAARAGLALYTVQCKRRELGLPPPTRREVTPSESPAAAFKVRKRARGGPPQALRRDTRVANQHRWEPRFARMLGKVPDAVLARGAHVALTTVVKERRRRGIPPNRSFAPPVEWTEEMIALLGEASDRQVAEELGVSKSSVAYKRTSLGIQAYGEARRKPDRFWTAKRISLLGTARDLEVARRLRVSRARVAYQRRVRGIPPFVPRRPRIVWTEAMVALMGRVADAEIARRFGIGEDAVRWERHRRGIEPLKDDSWTVSRDPGLRDLLRLQTAEVGAKTGLNEKTIRRLRHDLGVPQPGRATAWTPEARALLGVVDDDEVARRLGLKVDTVRLERTRAGIKLRVTRRWTEAEDELVRTLSPEVAARATKRSLKAVHHRRARLGLPRR
jgi:hypothetical protein